MSGAVERGQRRTGLSPGNAVPPRSRAGRAFASVARISGGVSYCCGGDSDGWQPASLGLSVASGDRLYAARGGRLELRTAGFDVQLESGAGLEVLLLTGDVNHFYVWGGVASFFVRLLPPGEVLAVDTPSAAVRFQGAGAFRTDVGREGGTRVEVDRGSAWVSAAGVAVPLGPGGVLGVDGPRRHAQDGPSVQPLDRGDSDGVALPPRVASRVLPFRPGAGS